MMLLCSPHNPVSRLWRAEELQALAALLRKYSATLVSDEIHADFVYGDRPFLSALSLPEGCCRRVCLVAASKTFNIAGLKQAWLICRDPALLGAFSTYLDRYGVESENLFALEACRAAFSLCDGWLDALLTYLRKNRRLVRETLARLLPDAVLSPIEATYLAWVDISRCGSTSSEVFRRCLQRGVVPSVGTFFGKAAGEGFMRLNFACPAGQLAEGLQRFANAVKNE